MGWYSMCNISVIPGTFCGVCFVLLLPLYNKLKQVLASTLR